MRTSLGFKSSQRLNSADQFTAVFDAGKRFYLKTGMFIAKPNANDSGRLGCVIAKKKCRLATRRNYLKRLVREGFRINQHQLKGYDVVYVASHHCMQLDRKALWASVQADFGVLIKRLTQVR